MKLYIRSFLLILALYGLLFAVGDAYLSRHDAPVWVAAAFATGIVLLQYALGPYLIQFFLKIHWDDGKTELPARNREFLEKLCFDRGLKMPRIGIIESATPNAFTFGHVPSNARVVVTSGLLAILTPEETNTVLAHEMGHVEHRDFIVMTLGALAPLLLYQVYVFSRSSNKTRAVALGAYLAYVVSEYIVFLLSRTREYFADQYSAQATGTPDLLAGALVKIAYGIFQADGAVAEALEKAGKEEKKRLGWERARLGSMTMMGISNSNSGHSLGLCGEGTPGPEAVMRWDLVNPWARLYELNSTHPLTAFRIQALHREAQAMHRPVAYPLPTGERIRWAAFPPQFVVWAAPWACAIGTLLLAPFGYYYGDTVWLPQLLAPALLALTGLSLALRTSMRYRGEYRPATIASLMNDVDACEMRPRAVRLEGTVVGFGVPGAYFCADLVLRDATGILFVLYKQSLPLARFLFAVKGAADFIGKKVVLDGWFRRGLRPYVEISRMTCEDRAPVVGRARLVLHALAALLFVAGAVWLAAVL